MLKTCHPTKSTLLYRLETFFSLYLHCFVLFQRHSSIPHTYVFIRMITRLSGPAPTSLSILLYLEPYQSSTLLCFVCHYACWSLRCIRGPNLCRFLEGECNNALTLFFFILLLSYLFCHFHLSMRVSAVSRCCSFHYVFTLHLIVRFSVKLATVLLSSAGRSQSRLIIWKVKTFLYRSFPHGFDSIGPYFSVAPSIEALCAESVLTSARCVHTD